LSVPTLAPNFFKRNCRFTPNRERFWTNSKKHSPQLHPLGWRRLWESLLAIAQKSHREDLAASSHPKFAQIYWKKYLLPRQQSFAIVLENAKMRGEIQENVDPRLVFDIMSGIMLYALMFQPAEAWESYVRHALQFILRDV
jgi:hypothetical protein